LALAWLINLTNFMDGIDGIAGAEAVTVAGICCALSTMAHGVNVVALLFAVLAASATGFLIWNWYPVRIFMGDAGSGFLGFCFGALGGLPECPVALCSVDPAGRVRHRRQPYTCQAHPAA